MTHTTLHEVEETLQQVDHDTLREMVYQAAHNHISVCELTSQVGDCSHVGANEIRDRVDGLSVVQMAAILALVAWMSIDIHRRVGS